MNDWLATLHTHLLAGKPVVRVAMATVRGSAPREAGATMLVSNDDEETRIEGTIGGGHLEWKAIEIARTMLTQPELPASRMDRFALGATLGQCCGGAVELWFERYDVSAADFVAGALQQRGSGALLMTTLGSIPERCLLDAGCDTVMRFPADKNMALLRMTDEKISLVERIDPAHEQLWLFGAGHVGKALVKVLADLPLHISWIDNREDMFPSALPANVTPLMTDDPADAVRNAPSDTWFLVLTHSHDIDYEISRAILARADACADIAWLGLIGSQTKATRFTQRLRRHGIAEQTIARMTCPIGLSTITSKLPAAIALSVATQLLGLIEQRNAGEEAPSLHVTRARTR